MSFMHQHQPPQSIPELPVDFHCHGIGPFDFTEINELNLQKIEDILARRKQSSILTLYLPKPKFNDFLDFMEHFNKAKETNKYPHILGIALEGPLLASHGGTPEKGVWCPTKKHWEEIANCGKKGLIYNILSPDFDLPTSNFANIASKPSISWITETLLKGGVLPAPGHFTKSTPIDSAARLQIIFDIASEWNQCPIITDHLYNDMPNNFKHAWRGPKEKAKRNREIEQLDLSSWNLGNLEEKLGIVPATIIKNAHKGIVKICINFDGEHVDLSILKKTIELAGAENILMMTDSIESKRLAGRNLYSPENSTLLYQDKGIVAAGSQQVNQQIHNMLDIDLNDDQIRSITISTPRNLLQKRHHYLEKSNHDQISYI